MEITLNVVFGLTPELREVLGAAASGATSALKRAAGGTLSGAASGATSALERAALEKTQAQILEAPAAAAAAPAPAAPAPAEESELPFEIEATPATAAPAAAAPAAAAETAEEITDAHMRQYMDRQMERFCGKGWRDATDAATLKLRKECTRCFKMIAKHLGAEKPTALEGANRVKFVMHLEEMTSDGKEVIWTPF